jgi:hypothetical protein
MKFITAKYSDTHLSKKYQNTSIRGATKIDKPRLRVLRLPTVWPSHSERITYVFQIQQLIPKTQDFINCQIYQHPHLY